MEQVGYSLVDGSGNEIVYWGDTCGQTSAVPNVVILPNGDHVHCPVAGIDYGGCRVVPRWVDTGADAHNFDGTRVLVTRPLPPTPVPARVTRHQYYMQAVAVGWMTEAQAQALIQLGTIPPNTLGFINTRPAGERFAATMYIVGAPYYDRANPLLNAMTAAGGITSQFMDDFFRAAALL